MQHKQQLSYLFIMMVLYRHLSDVACGCFLFSALMFKSQFNSPNKYTVYHQMNTSAYFGGLEKGVFYLKYHVT